MYIIRHGVTDWNKDHRLQGRTDVPLNDEGRQMAEKAAVEYKAVHFDICFCSPLARAKETAQILLRGRNIPVVYDDRLVEMGFGKFEGRSNSYNNPELPLEKLFDPEEYNRSIEGSETFEELFARTGAFIREMVDPLLEEGKDVLIVGHGAMNSSIICRRRNMDIRDFWSVVMQQCKLVEI